jgi:hypothetical protein
MVTETDLFECTCAEPEAEPELLLQTSRSRQEDRPLVSLVRFVHAYQVHGATPDWWEALHGLKTFQNRASILSVL